MEPKQKLKALSKKELAAQYGVSTKVLRSWIKNLPDANITPKQKTLTLKQLRIIYNSIGEP